MTTLKYGDHTAELADLSPASLAYLAQYGFAKSLQDSVAGLAKAVKADPEDYRKDVEDGTAMDDEELAKAVTEAKMLERFQAIIAGTVGTRSGTPRLSGIDKIMRDVAREAIKARAVAKGVKMPEGDDLAGIVAKYLSNHPEVRDEAERRQKAQASLAEGMEDDLGA